MGYGRSYIRLQTSRGAGSWTSRSLTWASGGTLRRSSLDSSAAAASAHRQWVFQGERRRDSQTTASDPRSAWKRAYRVSSSAGCVRHGKTGTARAPKAWTCHRTS